MSASQYTRYMCIIHRQRPAMMTCLYRSSLRHISATISSECASMIILRSSSAISKPRYYRQPLSPENMYFCPARRRLQANMKLYTDAHYRQYSRRTMEQNIFELKAGLPAEYEKPISMHAKAIIENSISPTYDRNCDAP